MVAVGLALLLFCLSLAHGQPVDIEDASSQIAEQYTEITVRPDGTFEEVTSNTFKALTDRGRLELALMQVHYQPAKEKVEIIDAELISNGRSFPVPRQKIFEKSISASKVGITNVKEITIPFEGVRINSLVKYRYRRTFLRPTIPGYFQAGFVYGMGKPELNSTVKIRSAVPLDFQAADPKKELTVNQKRDGDLYVLEVLMNKPIYSITEEQIARKSITLDDLKAIPRVNVASKKTWTELAKDIKAVVDRRLSEPLPKPAAEFLLTLNGKTSSQKIALIREWLGTNVSYSGRWSAADSDWTPRPVAEIVKSKVGDCKDFAILLMRMLREVKVDSDFTVVKVPSGDPGQDFMSLPLDEKKVLPALLYFNHAIVTVKTEQGPIHLDPTLNLYQGEFSDFHLHEKRAWVISPTAQGTETLRVRPAGKSKVTAAASKNIDGFSAKAQIHLEGQLGEFYQALRSEAHVEKFGLALAALAGFPTAEKVVISKSPPLDRKLTALDFEIEFFSDEQFAIKGADSVTYNFYSSLLPMYFSRLNLSNLQLDFPFNIEKRTAFPRFYVADEVKQDCVALGPIARYFRTVVNGSEGLSLEEDLRITLEAPGDVTQEKVRSVWGAHYRRLSACALSEIKMVPRNPGDKTQVAFEDSVNPDPLVIEKVDPTEYQAQAERSFRRWKTLIARQPGKADYYRLAAGPLMRMGMITSDNYIPAALDEARSYAEKAVRMDPKSVSGLLALGGIALKQGDFGTAVDMYKKAYALDPKKSTAFSLAGDIAYRKQDMKNAEAYYKLASRYAISSDEMIDAASGMIQVLCRDTQGCLASKPYVEMRLAAEPDDPWNLHNNAVMFSNMRDYKRAIELERKALAKMKFGLAEENLKDSLAYEALTIMGTANLGYKELSEAEALLLEASQMDGAESSYAVQAGLFKLSMLRAALYRDPEPLKRMEKYLANLKKMPLNQEQQVWIASMLQNTEGLRGAVSRMPAASNGYSLLMEKYAKDVSSPEGKAYDNPATIALSETFRTAAKACVKAPTPFEAALEIGADGTVAKWTERAESPETRCIRGKLPPLKAPKPPFAPFTLVVGYTLRP